jgi:PAS domain S-box-containing protein
MSDSLLDPAAVSLNRRAGLRREEDIENELRAEILEQIPDAILRFDENWVVTYANAEAMRISRIQPSDLNTRTHWELFPETLGTEIEFAYRDVMVNRVARHAEHFYAPFGVWIDVHAFPIDGGIALHYRDITQRKNAEKLRDDATRQMQQIFDASADSIVCIDRNWICTFANRAALVLFKADHLIGENLWERFAVNNEEPFRSNYLATMERRVPTEFEAYIPAPIDGWFKVLARPYEDGMVIFATDITDRKGAELLRDTSVRQLSQVLEITTDAVATLDRNWNYTFLNRRARELLSPKGDLIGKNLWVEFPDAVKSEDLVYHYYRAMDKGIAGEFEFFYPEPLNLWLSIQCRPFEHGMVAFFRDITARRHSDMVLKQQQDLLASVQHTALLATWDIDYATGKVTYGAGSYPVFGHPLAEIPDLRAFNKILLPEYVGLVREAIQTGVETGRMIVQDFQVRAANGRYLWLESRGRAVYTDGKPTSLRGVTIDITERKKNEEMLIASEARYRVLADLNPQAIWMGAPDGSITYANQGFLDYVGLTIEGLSGEGWLRAFYPADQPQIISTWMHSFETGDDYDVEARIVRAKDKQPRWWHIRARPVRDEAGKILNWLGVAMDIHDSKTFAETLQRRQEETERQRAELESIYQTAPVGLALFDAKELRYLRINDRQVEIVGLPKDQIVGTVITDIIPLKGLKELLLTAASGQAIRNQTLEGELPSRPGELRSWNVSYSPVFNAAGGVEAIAAAVMETTHQKKAEAALIQSEKLAAVGRLASSISHEINNPLEAITNLLYLINLSGDLPEGVRQYVQTAQSELSRVCQIATQTLRFHRQAVRATRVTAFDLVDAVLNLYQGRLANSNILVDAVYATSNPILCFENDIRQVLNNLIANAIDAMRQSGGRLVIRAHNATDRTASALTTSTRGRRGVRITIADTGHGIPKAVQERIFEPFYTTKDLNGTGLGLWISAGIISRHQGRLTFRSSQDPVRHGTIFSLFLPWTEEPASELSDRSG